MTVHPFDWRDIPTLHRLRHQSVFLDSALVLTRGPLLGPGALLSYLAPAAGVYTSVMNGESSNDPAIIGQVIHAPGSQFAHLTFLTPQDALESPEISVLLEHLVKLCGERGIMRLLADVDERAKAYESLRRNGFVIFSRQRIWQLTAQIPGPIKDGARFDTWRTAKSRDAIAIRALYNNLVPGLVQQMEPLSTQRPKGVLYHQGDELMGYVELRYGPRGIWVQPFIHPDAEEVMERIMDLVNKIPNRRSRPVYICVRSYQSWLESAVEELGAEAGPRQAVMARSLVMPQKAARAFALPALEGGQAEISAPIAHSESK